MNDQSKISLLHKIYAIGILEELNITLKLFETVMPEFFSGAVEIQKSGVLEKVKESSQSIGKVTLSAENRKILENRMLRYEMDYYFFARQVFDQEIKKYGIS